MTNYVSAYTGAQIDSALGTVAGSNLSTSHKITRSATLVIAASDSPAKSKAQADYVCDGTADNVEIQAALDALPATGGEIKLLEGAYTLAATVTRAIDSITVTGSGYNTYLHYTALLPLFSCGTQEDWLFQNFRTDSGGLDVQDGVRWGMSNIWRETYGTNVMFIDSWSADSISKAGSENIQKVISTHKGIKLLSDFETETDWTGTGGTITYDTSIKNSGTKSIKSVTPTDSNSYLTYTLSPLPDFSDCSFGLLVYSPDHSKLGSIDLRLRCNTTDWAHYYHYDNGAVQHIDGKWFMMIFSTLEIGAGTPDFAQANDLSIRIKNINGQSATVYVDKLYYWKKTLTPKGAVTFSFDDGLDSTYSTAKPILDAYRFPAVIGYVVGRFTPTTLAQAKEMQVAGWDIANHSLEHEEARLNTEPNVQILLAQKYLAENGFKEGSRFYLVPFGLQTNEIVTALDNNVTMSRASIEGYNSLPGLGNLIQTQTLQAITTVATVKGWIDFAIANKLWLNIMCHGIVVDPTEYNWSPTDFAEVVAYCNTTGIEVLTYSQIVDKIKSSSRTLTNTGTGTISNGTTSINITHGFLEAPTEVQITPTSSLGSAASMWVSSKNVSSAGRQFTVSVNADPGADVTFDWKAVI